MIDVGFGWVSSGVVQHILLNLMMYNVIMCSRGLLNVYEKQYYQFITNSSSACMVNAARDIDIDA